jgi:phospholipase D1/2
MIVDDVWTVIGSANINDRSMLGVRDSEVAIITRDKAPADGKMNGRNARVSSFAQSLRISLWREHLGLLGVRRPFPTLLARKFPHTRAHV